MKKVVNTKYEREQVLKEVNAHKVNINKTTFCKSSQERDSLRKAKKAWKALGESARGTGSGLVEGLFGWSKQKYPKNTGRLVGFLKG